MDEPLTIEVLLGVIKATNIDADITLISQAYQTASQLHADVVRKTGEPYINHPLGVAMILAKQGFCGTTIMCATLLHDVLEDTGYSAQTMRTQFGDEITNIVLALTKLTEQETGYENYKAENLRKLIVATAKDTQVMIIKIADRLHNMRTLSVFRTDKQLRIAQETLDVFAPMAEKLGLYAFRSELEDLSFAVLNPKMMTFIRGKINATKEERDKNTAHIIERIKSILKSYKLEYSIYGRAKHYYSIFRKMSEENKTFEQIYDIYGVRLLVKSVDDCYKIHTILCSLFEQVPQRYKDFIKNPKPNGYQSIHDNFLFDDKVIEVQIRTISMDNQAESGVASYWRYKGTERDKKFERKLSWLRQLITWRQKNKGATQDVSIDIFKDEIVAVTPKGDPIILASGATPIDFAYAIHSNIGDHIKNAWVNGKVAPLETQLHSGDIVRIETANAVTANENWLTSCKLSFTQQKIRRALGLVLENTPSRSKAKSKVPTHLESVYRTLHQLKDVAKRTPIKVSQCCLPTPETPIVAYYTKDKKLITVHKIDCPNQHALDPKNRVVLKVAPTKHSDIWIEILMHERPGLLVSVLNTLLNDGYRIKSVNSTDAGEDLMVSVEVLRRDEGVIKQTVSSLRKIDGIIDVKVDAA